MASDFQESLLQSIDYLINNRVQKLDNDKTITARIVSCENSLLNYYKVQYNSGFLYAYAAEGTSYTTGVDVFILVPEGDFTKKKIILSRATEVTEDSNITFVSSLINNYNMIGQNVVEDASSSMPQGLHSYLKEEYILLYQRGDEEHSLLTVDETQFSSYIKDAEALLIEASFMTRLPKAHRLAKDGVYGIQYVLAFKDRDKPEETKYVSYVLDSNQMTGNPFLYNTYTDQYGIFPIDTENFLYIDSIMIYEKGFVSESDTVQADFWGADILVKDVEIYGLRQITATNGDYTLRLSTPQGALFHTLTPEETLTALGTVTYQNTTDVSDSTSYYWFTKDDRVDATSEHYNIYGGSGWKYLKDKGNNRTLATSGSENRAYENRYLIAAVYKEQVILKEEFTLYNEAASRDISIESNLGTTFAFDRGTPTLTCLVNGNSENFDEDYPDAYFSFSWAKIDAYGNTTPLNETYEQLETRYEQGLSDGLGYSELAAIRNQMQEMKDVEFSGNVLTYPVRQIESTATFSCSVFLKETSTAESFFIGSASITLQNEGVASPTDYYILIENGDQVFQYSESGVAPTSERYQDPQEVLPLECHFFDPAGLEVSNQTYSVKWKVPLEDTLIVTPRESMELNPATELEEWYTQEVYPLDIEDSYDYQALKNQVTCIVEYAGIEYQKDSNLFFTKVGENGTNGTDVVCKISPVQEPQEGLLAIETRRGSEPLWNNGRGMSAKMLQFQLYNRTELMDTPDVSWTVSGGSGTQSRYMSVDLGVVSWADSGSGHRNQIVRGMTRMEGQTYYAFYPIPVISYNTSTQYKVIIDKTYTLKSITYNADGRNPLYNKNQGVFFKLDNGATNKYVVFDVMGGMQDSSATAAIGISFERDNASPQKRLEGGSVNDDGLYYVYVTPDDTYDGAWCNNIVRARIYGSQAEVTGSPEATLYMPIYMSLNTFGLASLNAWDGNHVEINEDENYILAPQIGAGVKDNNNRFTGVVMGTAQTYDQDEPDVGLLGYSQGKQSIFLDAETGNAIFGLPEDQASTNNQYTEGRIELIPGGESKIGMWNIGSRAMYNITQPPIPVGEDEEGNIEFEDNYVGVAPDGPYRDYPVPDAQISVPPEAQGLILNANPAYISVKGMPLNDDNSNIEWEGANTAIKRGDSIEVELDPRKSSVFSIYRHTTWDGDEDTGSWHRYPLVGINANGQFYTNAIEDGESSMGIGRVGAFGYAASDAKWVGAQFAYHGSNVFKFFIPEDDTSAATRPLYITAGTTLSNEYPRDVSIYGRTIHLYSNSTNSTDMTSPHFLDLDNDQMYMGHTNNYIRIPSAAGSQDHDFEIYSQATANLNFSGDSLNIINAQDMTLTTETLKATIDSGSPNNLAVQTNIRGSVLETGFQDYELSSNAFTDTAKNYSMTIKASVDVPAEGDNGVNETPEEPETVNTAQMRLGNEHVDIQLNDSTVSEWNAEYGMRLQSTHGPIEILSDENATGITIAATWGAQYSNTFGHPSIRLVPSSDGNGDFIIQSGHGTVRSRLIPAINRSGIELTSGIYTNWGYFVGTVPGSTTSISATRDIRSSNGWVYAVDHAFNQSKNYNITQGRYNSNSLGQHLDWIYSLLSSLGSRMNSAETSIRNLNNSVSTLNSNLTSLTNRYNGHTHQVTVDRGTQGFVIASSNINQVTVDGTHNVLQSSGLVGRLFQFTVNSSGPR